jgi:hypothetical protein
MFSSYQKQALTVMISPLWKKPKLNSEKIWKIQKKSKLNNEMIWKCGRKVG